MNRTIRRVVILLAAIAVIVLLRVTVFRPKPVPVTVFRVDRGRVEDTVVNTRAGTVESRSRSRMSPGTAGLVAEIPVKKGTVVKRGEVLLRIEDSEYRAQVNLAARSLDAAKASEEEACTSAAQAERELRRVQGLAEKDLVSEQELEKATTSAEVARAACAAAGQRVRQADAALEAARATLEKTVITAPFDGVVLDITTEVGEWISPSPPGVFIPPVVDVIDPENLYVSAPLDEVDAARVRVGLPVRITLDAFRGRSFAGTLTYVASFVETREEQNRTLAVEAVFTEDALPPNLLPGLSADVEIILDSRREVLRVPTYALLEGDRVLVARDGRLRSQEVKTGLRNWEFTEIDSGLAAGDQVVVSLDRPEVKAGARAAVTAEPAR
jgi:HlyD family secretion protein